MAAWVLHVDLDQFIAAVEVLRDPSLAGKPVVVGGRGDPAERAVVATASYEAREFGVHSGIPLRLAKKRCPDAIFLPHDPPAYDAASAEVYAVLRSLDGVVVEALGWDEAFLGVTTDDPVAFALSVRAAVLEHTRLSCSIGIGDNKLRAKLATGFAKCRNVRSASSATCRDVRSASSAKAAGVYQLTRDNWFAVMAERPTTALWGIGAKTGRKLAELGFTTVAELARAEPEVLAERLGPRMGPWYRGLARGAGSAEVTDTPWVAKSRSRETTFQVDLTDGTEIAAEVSALARRVAADVVAEGRPAARVAVKVRFAPFFTHTRSMTLPSPTDDVTRLTEAALAVLAKFELDRPVRLLGVRAEFPES
ncbi:DNA polymerase IV [Actinophytocola algeriensis]|uniref:DNA polymerase-4 n=1 Tax=Actinophytocola algeriensis TaxID=1768010 RepID=A0A7W7QBU7_9PSEU|nr:DNA polymerase IV [Actinophytocola algeriensis]MBB4910399.1 DNA polymerase-4 [Actinophytocola algeriensis]MBE1480612.1 DNA polymerase-4 [Actinophytocola algeriensis]